MYDKDKMTMMAFEKLTDEEQLQLIKELRKDLGGCEVDLKCSCPIEVKEWWEGKARDIVNGGVESMELLMSHFFLAMLKNSLANPVSNFNDNVAIALSILRGDVKVTFKTPTDTLVTEVEPDEDIGKKTFH